MKTTTNRAAKNNAAIALSDDASVLLRYMSMRGVDDDKVFASDAMVACSFTRRQHTDAAEALEALGFVVWLAGVKLPGGFSITLKGREFYAASAFAA